MRILQLSTQGIRCGIANYAEMLAEGIKQGGHGTCDIHPINLDVIHRLRGRRAIAAYYTALLPVAKKYDIVHLQHEYGFFGSGLNGIATANTTLGDFLLALEAHGIPSATTFHTDPHMVASPFRFTARPHKLLYRLRKHHTLRSSHRRIAKAFHKGNAIAIAHNAFAAESLHNEYEIPRARIHQINLLIQKRTSPCVPERKHILTAQVSQALALHDDSVVIGIIGFISEYKGHLDAVRALHLLPANHKLLIIGGTHPHDHSLFLNKLLKFIRRLKLESRVFITGVFEDADLQYYLNLTNVIIAPYADNFRSSSGAITLGIDCGKPMIASAIKPFVELHRQTPWLELYTPGGVHELAYRIKTVMSSPETRDRLAKAATVYARDNAPDKIAARHVSLFRTMTG